MENIPRCFVIWPHTRKKSRHYRLKLISKRKSNSWWKYHHKNTCITSLILTYTCTNPYIPNHGYTLHENVIKNQGTHLLSPLDANLYIDKLLHWEIFTFQTFVRFCHLAKCQNFLPISLGNSMTNHEPIQYWSVAFKCWLFLSTIR